MDSKILELIAKNTGLSFDGGDGDNRLFYDGDQINVFACIMSEKEWSKMEKEINKKQIKGKGYTVGAWNDSSSYEFWKKNSEANYIQVTVYITDLNKVNIEKMKQDAQKLFDYYKDKYDNYEDFLTRGPMVG